MDLRSAIPDALLSIAIGTVIYILLGIIIFWLKCYFKGYNKYDDHLEFILLWLVLGIIKISAFLYLKCRIHICNNIIKIGEKLSKIKKR